MLLTNMKALSHLMQITHQYYLTKLCYLIYKQIIGEAFSGIAAVFLIIAAVGKDWVEVQFYRTSHVISWGLWDICVGGLCLPDSGNFYKILTLKFFFILPRKYFTGTQSLCFVCVFVQR